jgi:hypothetical protein
VCLSLWGGSFTYLPLGRVLVLGGIFLLARYSYACMHLSLSLTLPPPLLLSLSLSLSVFLSLSLSSSPMHIALNRK